MQQIAATNRTRVKRLPTRASYDRAAINSILDEAMLSHVAFAIAGQPYAIPTLHVRIGDHLYIHGSAASRMLGAAAAGADLCVTATLIDGLVLARSAFHHSVNYRSVVILGKAAEVTEPAHKDRVLRELVEKMIPHRWDTIRPPSEQELKATSVLAIPISEASAKIRTGGPSDDDADYALPAWAGVIPLRLAASGAIPDTRLAADTKFPAHVAEYRTPSERAGGIAHDGAPFERVVGEVAISTDIARLDIGVIHEFLSRSYWAENIPRETVARAVANSLCFGAYVGTRQIGLVRVISDYATYAYVADVFVIEEYRGRGISKALMAAATEHPHLQGLRRWTLGTRDAHGLYRKFGFTATAMTERWMERADLDVYRRVSGAAK